MDNTKQTTQTKQRIQTILPHLNEKQKRLYLAKEANSLGHGGLKTIHELTGVSKTTIIKGQKELKTNPNPKDKRIRKKGAGRKSTTHKYPDIQTQIQKILDHHTTENPPKTVWWTNKSLRKIQQILHEKNINLSHDTIGNILNDMNYRLQQNQKITPTEPPRLSKN
ncbi:MAG: hypothetical protein LBQ98_07905 [Nitrososphaerota archaeon]|jgi:hypothetical protein|nr:hypothetical protein [Nitrososphaerota archaeon]